MCDRVVGKPRYLTQLGWVLGLVIAGCGRNDGDCPRCRTLVVAATGSPDALLPPLVGGSVGRDISDLIFERLATLAPGSTPSDSSAYRPGLAVRWERIDSLTLRFHLRPGARWQDGPEVEARDVVFSFAAYADTSLDASARPIISRLGVSSPDDSTVDIRFPEPDAEQWYDATWFVRVVPRHLWDTIPLCLMVRVRSDWWRQGVGRALYAAVEGTFRRQGCAFWLSSAEETNERSHLFHEALGFRRIGVLAELGQDVPEVFYRRDIV